MIQRLSELWSSNLQRLKFEALHTTQRPTFTVAHLRLKALTHLAFRLGYPGS